MTTDEFIAAARSMLGVRFKHQGRSPEFGVDCAGLAACAAVKCGHEPVDRNDYARWPSFSDLLEQVKKNCDQVPPGSERPGDLMLFETAGRLQHLGILTETNPPSMIHAYAPQRKVVEHRMDAEWLAKRRFIFRIRQQEQ